MKCFGIISVIVLAIFLAGSAFAQRSTPLAANAALRYWSAFSQVQDAYLNDPDAKQLNAILDGTAPYDDAKYKDLLEKNKLALEIMARGTSLPNCDWGLDYGLGDDIPVEYNRKALVLGRLNALYAFHLFLAGDNDGGVSTLVAGLRFSHDVGNGGSLFATLIAQNLLIAHLRAVDGALHIARLSASQRLRLQNAVAGLGAHGLDWEAAMKIEMSLLNKPPWQASIPLENVTKAYVLALRDPSQLSKLQQLLAGLPEPLRDVIPLPAKVLQQEQELDEKLAQTHALF